MLHYLEHQDHILPKDSVILHSKDLASVNYTKMCKLSIIHPTILSFGSRVYVKVCNPFNPYFHIVDPDQKLYIYYPCIVTFHEHQTGPATEMYVMTNTFTPKDACVTTQYRLAILAILQSAGPTLSGEVEFDKPTIIVGNTSGTSFVASDGRSIGNIVKDSVQTYNFYRLPAGKYQVTKVKCVPEMCSLEYCRLHEAILASNDIYPMLRLEDILLGTEYFSSEDTVFSLGPGSDFLV